MTTCGPPRNANQKLVWLDVESPVCPLPTLAAGFSSLYQDAGGAMQYLVCQQTRRLSRSVIAQQPLPIWLMNTTETYYHEHMLAERM